MGIICPQRIPFVFPCCLPSPSKSIFDVCNALSYSFTHIQLFDALCSVRWTLPSGAWKCALPALSINWFPLLCLLLLTATAAWAVFDTRKFSFTSVHMMVSRLLTYNGACFWGDTCRTTYWCTVVLNRGRKSEFLCTAEAAAFWPHHHDIWNWKVSWLIVLLLASRHKCKFTSHDWCQIQIYMDLTDHYTFAFLARNNVIHCAPLFSSAIQVLTPGAQASWNC